MTHPSAPGLKARRRADGTTAWYWTASVKDYEPRTVRLVYDDTPEGHMAMVARARVLQAEMLGRGRDVATKPSTASPGSIAWLVDRYQTDDDSPYHAVRPSTRKSYDESLKIVRATVGERRISAVAGPDVRRWFKQWGRDGANPRRAYGCIQLLRIVLAYGTSLRDRDCRDLRDVLGAMQFEQPGKRAVRMTFEQARAFRDKAHELGHHSLALAMALQFELGLRQRDVIGEWIAPTPATHQWTTGLTWSHIDGQMILRKPTSKSNGSQIAEHDLRRYPEVLAELDRVPLDRRVGPVVVSDETGRPYKRRHFAGLWRAVATAAGLPAGLWNMDSRAGAISEAYEAGAAPADVMKAATHTQIATSMRYNRGAIEQTSRVADLRAERRKRK